MTNRLLFSALLLIGVQGDQGTHATLAQFTTSVASTANQFSAGTVHISDSLGAGTTLTMSNLIAGDNFDAELNVANSGTLGLTYALSTLTSGDATLANTLQLTLRARTVNPCTNRDGAVLYSGALASAVLGNPAHGVQAGDRVLAAGASEVLCFAVELPSSASSSSLLDKALSTTFQFDAEQN